MFRHDIYHTNNYKKYFGICGNSLLDPGEQCEGTNFKGKTCQTEGYFTGNLICNNCMIDTVGCTNCSNNILDPGEQCEINTPNQEISCSSIVPHSCGTNKIFYLKEDKQMPSDVDWDYMYDLYINNRNLFNQLYGDTFGCYDLYGTVNQSCSRRTCEFINIANDCRICQACDYLGSTISNCIANENTCWAQWTSGYSQDIPYTYVLSDILQGTPKQKEEVPLRSPEKTFWEKIIDFFR